MAEAKSATKEYMVVRRCKTADGKLLNRETVYSLTDAEAAPLIENELVRLPKKGELADAGK